MPLRFAINGLGRIGRALLRVAQDRPELDLVAANDAADPRTLAALLRHDSVHGAWGVEISARPDALTIGGRTVALYRAPSPRDIPWRDHDIDVVVEATGRFRRRDLAARHLDAGARRVVISATASEVDATFCYGINHRRFDPRRHLVLSNASCTTNCLAPVLLVLHRAFGVEQALMNTVHCVTNSQNLVDMAHADLRRARSALANIVPTTSDAISSIGLVLPELSGRVEGLAMRVPVVAGSLIDLVVRLERPASLPDVAAQFCEAAAHDLRAILGVTEEELVSSDFVGDPRSAVVDLPLLQRAGDRLFRVVAWYDNEWGYANRLADLLAYLGDPS
jgi:glyceraldehyde 3-phosphate dehydrogenase